MICCMDLMGDDTYLRYCSYIRKILVDDDLFNTFKQSPDVTYMLEHTLPRYGERYLELLLRVGMKIDRIRAFCELNDSVGGAKREIIKSGSEQIVGSPSSLRYLYHAFLFLRHLEKNNKIILQKDEVFHIIEIGGGYGGLALCVDYLLGLDGEVVRIGRNDVMYHIIDLPEPLLLQERYLKKFRNFGMTISFHSAFEFGTDIQFSHGFLVANYSYSELSDENRAKYNQKLLTRVDGGFITWNADFRPASRWLGGHRIIQLKKEDPQTHVKNYYVFF